MTLQTPGLRFPETPDQRQQLILTAIRDCFMEKGFDGASMQDLARAAGMSVGNFYRYFPSKDAIVAALVMSDLAEVEAEFAAVAGSDDLLGTMRGILRQRICDTGGAEDALWAEISAAARRKPEIGAALSEMERCICTYLITVFAAVTGLPETVAAQRYVGHARLIVMLVKASAMRIPGSAPEENDLNELILRTIDRTLDEIALGAVKV